MSDEEAYYFHFFPEAMNSCFLDPHSCLSLSLGLTCLAAPRPVRFVPVDLYQSYTWEGRLVTVAFAWEQELLFSS